MSRTKLPVVAAIPNYNMAESLGELLPQIARQDYADIFVLDDASDDASRDVVTDFNSSVRFIAGEKNVGAGGNRNRILRALSHSAIIHFIDADMNLETGRAPELAQEAASSTDIGFVGGLIKDTSGRQHPFNYGPRQCLHSDIGANIQHYISSRLDSNPGKASAARERFHGLVADFPDMQAEPKPRKVFWAAEANLLIRSDTLKAAGGFDPRLRDHEIQDLAIRLDEAGAERRFDPLLSAVHKAAQVRSGNRRLQMIRAEMQISRKHGLLNWLFPDDSFKPAPVQED